MSDTKTEGYLPMLPIDAYRRGEAAGEDQPFDARVLQFYQVDDLPYFDLAPEFFRRKGDPIVYEACAIGVKNPGQYVGSVVDVTLGGHVHDDTHARVIKSIEFITV